MAELMKFSTESTNIFPAANSKLGGQLVSEWNLRSRETVGTPSKIKYMVGPSYVHSQDDYKVYIESTVGTSGIIISSGRGIFNGHFVESNADIVVDILELNNTLVTEGKEPLSGDLSVGIRVLYSTAANVADTIRVETDTLMYEGIKVVIQPRSQVKLPIDTPNNSSKITMHLKLADFTFVNGAVYNIVNNVHKVESIEAERVANIDDVISENFVKKENLDPDKFYVYNTRDAKMDNWCEAMDSLIVWDKAPGTRRVDGLSTELYNKYINELDGVEEATFLTTVDGRVVLRAPHKQIDGSSSILPDKLIFLPNADFVTNSPGVVSSKYTSEIKKLTEAVSRLLKGEGFAVGKCISYIDTMDEDGGVYSRSELQSEGKFPTDEEIEQYNVGDYVIVAKDNSINGLDDESIKRINGTDYNIPEIINKTVPTSTMYMIVYGSIASFDTPVKTDFYTSISDRPNPPAGFDPDTMAEILIPEDDTTPESSINATYLKNKYVDNVLVSSVQGVQPGKAYIVVRLKISDGNTVKYKDVYAKSKTVTKMIPERPIFLTDRTLFADTEQVGGFLNIDMNSDVANQGYVYLDSDGHLRVLDFEYLSQGLLAYQLGKDWYSDKHTSIDGLQEELDNYVNERIAFRSGSDNGNDSDVDIANNVINLHLYIPPADTDEDAVINIHSIDSRFGGSVYLHLYSQAVDGGTSELNAHNVINIVGCERIRINSSNIPGTPTINIKNSNVYYDREVFNMLNDIEGLGIWYEKYESSDLDILVDGMTVTLNAKPESPEVFDFWKDKVSTNDNHYIYALRSITFGTNGNIVGCSILIGDASTSTTSPDSIVAYTGTIKLPQQMGFPYPERRMQMRMKITGSFVSAYTQGDPVSSFIVRETEFSMLSHLKIACLDLYFQSKFLVDTQFYVGLIHCKRLDIKTL